MAEPIIINFPRPIADRQMAEQAIHVSSTPPVSGKFYWMTPTQVRWRPLSFWPAHTAVHIDAAGTRSDFGTGDSLIATADDATHQLTVTRNGDRGEDLPDVDGHGGRRSPDPQRHLLRARQEGHRS